MSPKNIFETVRKEGKDILLLTEAMEVLEYYKIPSVKWKFITNIEDGLNLAKSIGYPLALKIVSRDIIHKTDIGGVCLNINSEEELKNSFQKMLTQVKDKMPKAEIKGFVLQKMVEGGIETIVGGKKDVHFGQVVMFGLGGIFAEVLRDVSIRVCPIGRKDAREMIKEIKGYEILSGYRGKKFDIDAIENVILKVSKLLTENEEIKELDINPLIVFSNGAVAVDARIAI